MPFQPGFRTPSAGPIPFSAELFDGALDSATAATKVLGTVDASEFRANDFLAITFVCQASSFVTISGIAGVWLDDEEDEMASFSLTPIIDRSIGFARAVIASGSVPAKPSAAAKLRIAVTFSGNSDFLRGSLFRLRGANTTPVDTLNPSVVGSTTNKNGQIDVPAGGFLLAAGCAQGTTAAPQDQTWAGATELWDVDLVSNRATAAYLLNEGSAISDHTVGYSSAANTARALVAVTWAPAS